MPAVQPVRRRRPRAQVRADLLDAAERLVRTRGFRVSVEEIAAAAGMTKGAVYSNFANRAELMEAVAERVVPAPVDVDGLAPPGLPLDEAMERGARELARRVDDRPEQFVLMLDLLSEFTRDPELLARLRAAAPQGSGAPDRLQQRAERDRRALPRPAAELGVVIDSLSFGLAVTRLLRGPEAVPDDLLVWAFRKLVQADPA